MTQVRGVAYRGISAWVDPDADGLTVRWSNPWQADVASWALQLGTDPGLFDLTVTGPDPVLEVGPGYGSTLGQWAELYVTPTFENGTVGATGWAPLYIPAAYEAADLDGWSLDGDEVIVASQVTRGRAHLNTWPDGAAGWLPQPDGTVHMLSAGGAGDGGEPGIAIVELDRHGRYVTVVNHEATISGLPGDVDYAAGGPLLVNPDTGTVALVYHAEVYLDGPTTFWSFLGVARSTDGGETFEDLGAVAHPGVPSDDPSIVFSLDVGSGPVADHDGSVIVYLIEHDIVDGSPARVGITAAACPTEGWWSAVEAGDPPDLLKWDGADFTVDALNGVGTPVLEHPIGRWFDVCAVDGDLVLIASDGGYRDWSLIASRSTDGVTWPAAGRIPGSITHGDERLYLSATSAWITSTPKSAGPGGRLWLWRPVAQVGTGYQRWGDVALVRQRLTVGPSPT